MHHTISADLIVTNNGSALPNGAITYSQFDGKIIDIHSEAPEGSEYHPGVLVPGYINAHCHLELSHLKGVINTGTGLIPFIKGVVSLRDFPEDVIQMAIESADQEMYDAGIVAVGDISNKIDTARVKGQSKIRYYTFVEMFDFLQEQQAEATFQGYQKVYDGHISNGFHKKSYVPHAPYSVSKRLFQYVNDENEAGCTVSIHNQELKAENELFLRKEGAFMDFFNDFGVDLSDFQSIGQSAIHYTLKNLDRKFKTLMVHNTQTSKEDISKAMMWHQDVYWATCPNANLYIENKLPIYQDFVDCGAKMCIGTDSYSSNWQLSIFEEMKTIKRYQNGIDDLEIIKWATINGARALGFDELGKLSVGQAPGLNLIKVPVLEGRFDLSKAIATERII